MTPDDIKVLLELPWATLLALACGYVGYFVAHVGIRDHHKTVDVIFATCVFGFLSSLTYQLALRQLDADRVVASVVTFALAGCAGAFWNARGRKWFYRALRFSGTTTNDDLPSAWAELFSERQTDVSQVAVKLTDGTWLKCSRAKRFDSSPHGSVVFGGVGDMLIYVTHVQGPEDEDFVPCTSVQNEDWGDEITYLPKEQIARVDIRKKWK